MSFSPQPRFHPFRLSRGGCSCRRRGKQEKRNTIRNLKNGLPQKSHPTEPLQTHSTTNIHTHPYQFLKGMGCQPPKIPQISGSDPSPLFYPQVIHSVNPCLTSYTLVNHSPKQKRHPLNQERVPSGPQNRGRILPYYTILSTLGCTEMR